MTDEKNKESPCPPTEPLDRKWSNKDAKQALKNGWIKCSVMVCKTGTSESSHAIS